jgi:hypothetical protein
MIQPTPANLEPFRQLADPLADEALAQLVAEEGPDAALQFFNTLIRNIDLPIEDLPPALDGFLAATSQLPDVVDLADLQKAASLFLDHGPKFLIFLYFKSLPMLYSDARGAKVLIHTGRLAHDGAEMDVFARRIAETGQFLLGVMAPGALKPGGKGIRMIQKVRLIHASIRHFIPSDRWDANALGKPINQEDLALTLMTFGTVMIQSLEELGIDESSDKKEAYIRCWNAIGALLGIHPDLLPADYQEALQLLDGILAHQSAPSEEGRLLTQSLIRFSQSTLPASAQKFPELLIKHFAGAERARYLGLETNSGCLGIALPGILRKVFSGSEQLEDRINEPLRVFIEPFSRLLMQGMVGYFDKYKQQKFVLPEAFSGFLSPPQ